VPKRSPADEGTMTNAVSVCLYIALVPG